MLGYFFVPNECGWRGRRRESLDDGYIQLKCEWFDCLRVVFITFFFFCMYGETGCHFLCVLQHKKSFSAYILWRFSSGGMARKIVWLNKIKRNFRGFFFVNWEENSFSSLCDLMGWSWIKKSFEFCNHLSNYLKHKHLRLTNL